MFVRGSRGTYLVDLEEFGGNGWCGCQDFEITRYSMLRDGRRSMATRCKHIHMAIEYLGRRVAALMQCPPQPSQRTFYLLGLATIKRLRSVRLQQAAARYAPKTKHLLEERCRV